MKSLIFVILTLLFWGMAPVFAKLGVTKSDPFLALALRSFTISVILLAAVFVTGNASSLLQFEPRSAMLIAIEGIFASLVGHLFYYYALKYGEAGRVVPVVAAYPLVTVAAAYLLLGESLTVGRIIGALLVVSGIVLLK